MKLLTGTPNKFGGVCSDCEGRVQPLTGLLGPRAGGKFTVHHKWCTPAKPVTRPASARRWSGRPAGCITGGDCSSFGSGRSCGAHDCDGS
jgi:hypothetical protein